MIYFLKKTSIIECNYEIYDKKFIAIVRAFEKWQLKLKRLTSLINIILNYKNLKYFASSK